MKILLLGWNRDWPKRKGNWNHELFRRELARQHEVIFWGAGYDNYDKRLSMDDVLSQFPNTDIILTHYEHRNRYFPTGLKNIKHIPKIHLCGGDYDEITAPGWNAHFNSTKYDIIFGRYLQMVQDLKKYKVPGAIKFLPWSVDINVYKKLDIKKSVDVSAIFQAHARIHPDRHLLRNRLSKMKLNSFIGTAWFGDYIKKINESKICVSSNVRFPRLSGKYYEILACGTFFLTTRPEDFAMLGFEDNKHLILYKDNFVNFEEKINYYLEHEKEREKIALEGMNFVRKYHNTVLRVKQFIDLIEE